MEFPTNELITQTCNKHNEPIICFEQISDKPLCLVCLQKTTNIIPAELYQQKLKDFIKNEKLKYINNKQFYQDIHDSILNYKNSLIYSLDKILQNIQDQKKQIEQSEQQFLKYIEQHRQGMNIGNREKESLQQQICNERIKNQIKQLLEELQKKHLTSSEQLIASFDEKQKIAISEQILDWDKAECKIFMETNRNKFDKENNILVVACEEEIIVYKFKNGVITQELQRLTDHTDKVNCLYFMQKTNSFVSGSLDKSIIIWEFNNSENKWFAKQQLEEHTNQVYCIVMNTNEDLLISGSEDQNIRFWKKIKNNWFCQQTINIKNYVSAISFNGIDKIISCGLYQFISIIWKENDDQWRIGQTIKVSCYGLRLCFTDIDQFVFQPSYGDQLEIYSFDKQKQQFQIPQKLQINKQEDGYLYFPCQYIKQLKMIAVKHGKQLNIFKIHQTGDYSLIQSIDFESNNLYGRLTNDGQNLITWDGESKKVQVRKLKFLK